MVRSPRLLLLAALLPLAAVACGVEAGEQGSALVVSEDDATTSVPGPEGAPTTTEDDGSTVTVTDAERDVLVDTYTELGFTDEEANCLADQIADAEELDPSDAAAMMDLINQCDISMSRLMELTSNLGGEDGDLEETMRNSLAAGFRASGMTDEQADCAAAAYVEEFGTDPSSSSDPSAMLDVFEACDIDPSTLGG